MQATGKDGVNNEKEKNNSIFDFLGFTHYWTKSLRGNWVIKRRTAKKRIRRTVKEVWRWCRANRHRPLEEQHRTLSQKISGHIQYYGIRCNMRQMEVVVEGVKKAWRYWLSRRGSQLKVKWEKFQEHLDRFPLPKPKIIHSI